VTGLGENSPIVRLIALVSFSEKFRSSPNFFGRFVPREKLCMYKIKRKMNWATLWAIFPQTHLVTLVGLGLLPSEHEGKLFSRHFFRHFFPSHFPAFPPLSSVRGAVLQKNVGCIFANTFNVTFSSCVLLSHEQTRAARFISVQLTKTEKIMPKDHRYTKLPQNMSQCP
jgi:hypothetical protein